MLACQPVKRGAAFLTLGLAVACAASGRAPGRFVPSEPPPPAEPDPAPKPRQDGRLPQGVVPTRYRLDLTIDPSEPTFMGRVRIDVQVTRPTRAIVLHARGPQVLTASVDDGDKQWAKARGRPAANGKGEAEELVLVVPRPVRAGAAVIDIQYEAPFADGLRGIYRVKERGRYYAFSQMEPTDARRAFPCFDEPGFKTPFDVSITVPSEQLAVFNTPEERHRDNLTTRLTSFELAPTRPLPTYLIALAVGPLELSEGASQPTPVRAVTVPGKQQLTPLALATAKAQLAALSDYFGEPYPYPKLDLVAVPEFGAGAMENAGLVTFREEILLVDGKRASTEARKRLVAVMAHELAHQWFGDLVTMKWWNDVWLNEGLATWMGDKIVDQLAPGYGVGLESVSSRSRVMGLDSLSSARKIRQPVKSSSDALEAFDGITYDKAASVLRMVEAWVGEDAVRRGMRAYVRSHADGNASAEDLFTALDSASEKDVSSVMASFVDQTGVPLVEVKPSKCGKAGGATVELTQSELLPLGRNAAGAAKLWQLPVCVRPDGGAAVCTAMSAKHASIQLDKCPRFVIPNAESRGYYRSRMEASARSALLKNTAKLSEPERIGLVGDSWALVRSGQLGVPEFLDVVSTLSHDQSRLVWQEIGVALAELDDQLLSDASRGSLALRVRAWAAPARKRLTLDAQPGDSDDIRSFRSLIFTLLVDLGADDTARKRAAELCAEWLNDPAKVDPSLATAAVVLAARHGDRDLHDALVARLRSAKTPEARLVALGGLTGFDDPSLIERTLDLTLAGTIKQQDLRYVFRPLFERRQSRSVTYGWLVRHFDALAKRLPSFILGRLVWVAAGLCNEVKVDEAEAFFRPRLEHLEGADKHLTQALELGRLCARFRAAQRRSAESAFAPP